MSPDEIFGTVLDVRHRPSGERRRVTIDWRDNANLFCVKKLAESDLYLKRNLIPEVTFGACPAGERQKIRPAGLCFAVRGRRERPYWAQVVGGLYARESPVFSPSPREVYRRLRSAFVRAPRRIRTLRWERDFQPPPGVAERRVVLFQTRAYDPTGSGYPEDTRVVNEERARIIRRLREAFGDRFVGGFAADEFAQQNFRDCVSPRDYSEAGFCDLIKSSSVCVYTRGLRDSPAFKLAEYFAAGRAVVADEMRTQLPTPLVEGEHLLRFRNDQELLDQCERLMGEEELRRRVAAGAQRYYAEHIRPRNAVRRYLGQAFGSRVVPGGVA
jgi:hypothetical protein